MRRIVAVLVVSMLAVSVSAAGESGVNEETSIEETGISSLQYSESVTENAIFEISVMLDSDNNISKIDWITQVCINSGICWPPKSQELLDTGDGQTFVGSVMIDDYATYVNWRFDITRTDANTETVPDSGFGWKVWSDCWYDNETWGGPSTDCQGEEGVGSLLPGFAAPATAAGLAMAALMARRD